MFLSLNKKIILSIVALFLLCFSIFGYTLYSLFDNKLQEDQQFLHLRNSQYNELLYYYNTLKSELSDELRQQLPPINHTKFYQQENYRYQNILTNIRLILITLTIFSLLIVLMILFLHKLILHPVNLLTNMNQLVQKGIFEYRLSLPKKLAKDEFNILEQTYNNMLNNIEQHLLKIKEQSVFLQNILNKIPDAIRVIDFSGNIILVNEAYQKKVNSTASNCINQKCYTSLLKNDKPCNSKTTNCPLIALKKQKNIQFIQQLQTGQKQYMSVNAARIDTADMPLIIESFRDLSDEIKFSHQQKVSSLGFLTASIAHEIKNNLGSIRIILENIISQNTDKKTTTKHLNLIYDQLLECIQIPERLLKIAKFTPDKIQNINSKECILEICSLLDYEATHSGITINIEGDNNIPDIYINETDFKMIILNLAHNAIKAMPSGGTLSFSLFAHKNNLEIQIQDTGIGIASKHLPHIFEPFYCISEKYESSGLGLAIVKSLIHNVSGHISVNSKLGSGTCFKLKIPYKAKK